MRAPPLLVWHKEKRLSCSVFDQNRCLKIKGGIELDDLDKRRKCLAHKVFSSLHSLDTNLKSLSPSSLPSGRLDIPYCRTSLRRNAFIPLMSIETSSVFCDWSCCIFFYFRSLLWLSNVLILRKCIPIPIRETNKDTTLSLSLSFSLCSIIMSL